MGQPVGVVRRRLAGVLGETSTWRQFDESGRYAWVVGLCFVEWVAWLPAETTWPQTHKIVAGIYFRGRRVL